MEISDFGLGLGLLRLFRKDREIKRSGKENRTLMTQIVMIFADFLKQICSEGTFLKRVPSGEKDTKEAQRKMVIGDW